MCQNILTVNILYEYIFCVLYIVGNFSGHCYLGKFPCKIGLANSSTLLRKKASFPSKYSFISNCFVQLDTNNEGSLKHILRRKKVFVLEKESQQVIFKRLIEY